MNHRCAVILERLADNPQQPFTQAAANRAEAKACYRFLANDEVQASALMSGIAKNTAHYALGTIPEGGLLLAVHDTTSFNFTLNRSIKELGPIDAKGKARGLLGHSTLALNENGKVLGLLAQNYWVRKPLDKAEQAEKEAEKAAEKGKKKKKKKKKFESGEAKESFKWQMGMEQTQQVLHEQAWAVGKKPLQVLHIMDREGDTFDTMQWVEEMGERAILRSAYNREVDHPLHLAHDAVRAQPSLGGYFQKVPAKKGQPARLAWLELRVLRVTLPPDLKNYPHGRPMTWSLVEVYEPNPPAGATALHWLLWTNEEITTYAQAKLVAVRYSYRWRIEEFHLALKTGCQVESLRLSRFDRLEKALVLNSAAAARIVQMRDRAQETPDAPASEILIPVECCVLLAVMTRRGERMPAQLTIRQAILWIGRLGGHLNRRRDGLPGVRTLSRGLHSLSLLVEGHLATLEEIKKSYG